MSYNQNLLTPRTPFQPKVSTPANPATTTSLVGVMAGLAIAFTPSLTGRVKVTVQATLANATLADGASVQISFGTGTAPVNGAAITGTQVGKIAQSISPAANNAFTVTAIALITSLVVGTAYWFDIVQAAITAGTAAITNIVIIIEEF